MNSSLIAENWNFSIFLFENYTLIKPKIQFIIIVRAYVIVSKRNKNLKFD